MSLRAGDVPLMIGSKNSGTRRLRLSSRPGLTVSLKEISDSAENSMTAFWELKIDHGPGFRIYFTEDGDTVVLLLCGGDKSTQSKDIEKAHEYWTEYQEE